MEGIGIETEIISLIQHIRNWQVAIRPEVRSVLQKLHRQEALSKKENDLDVSPAELAAIWSVVNNTPVLVRYVREVKRDKRIIPSQEWGTGHGSRSLYKLGKVKDIRITHLPGRPQGSKNKERGNT